MADRQGLLKGELCHLQRQCLLWLIASEQDDKMEWEKYRTLNTALGSNPATSPDFIKTLLGNEPQEDELNWITPQSHEDLVSISEELGLSL